MLKKKLNTEHFNHQDYAKDLADSIKFLYLNNSEYKLLSALNQNNIIKVES